MARSVSQWTALQAKLQTRLSTVYGTPSAQNLPHLSLVVLKVFTWHLAPRFSTSVLPQAPQFHMLLIWLVRMVLFTLLNSHIVQVAILLVWPKKRTNVIPIIEDARHPHKYRMLVPMVDCIFADVAQPDQTRIVALNAHNFLKNNGHFVISIKASCIDSTAQPAAVFAAEVKKMKGEKMKPLEQLTLEPYERDHAVVVGVYSGSYLAVAALTLA
jgi:hypothetical protein